MFMIRPQTRDVYHPLYFYENAFSKEECESIKKLGIERGMKESSLFNDNIDKAVRNSQNSWIPWSEEVDWIYQRLSNFIIHCNNNVYNFDLNGFFEDIQFTRYGEGCFYNYHEDIGPGGGSIRKLSVVLQLSDENDYEGGELCLFSGNQKIRASKKQGTLIFFPSYVTHKVEKVKSGERFSLVSWISGQPFR